MGLSVVFVSGVRRSGKSALIQTMAERLFEHPPHYFRLVNHTSQKVAAKAKSNGKVPTDCHVASARWIEFSEDRIFEILPDALAEIHRKDRYGTVVIEADADPSLRCAYPYDHRVFVMPRPTSINEVFREAKHAAGELRRALDDTAAFASEIFGLFSNQWEDAPQPSEDRPEITASHMRGFLYSPLGDELATRIQLQTPYHGLVESDVIVVNARLGKPGPDTDACLSRIDRLLDRLRGASQSRGELYHCDPTGRHGDDCRRLFEALAPMCTGGK